MEIVEAPSRNSVSDIHQSQWLQATLSGVNEKMKAILNLLEDSHSPLQNAEMHDRRKESITKLVQNLCLSYRSLAENYDSLKSVSAVARNSGSSSPSNNIISQLDGGKNKDISGSYDDSNPESTVEDADIENDANDLKELHAFVHHNLAPKELSIKPENAWSYKEKFKMSRLVEDNTQVQVEFIRRNTEKRETIRKLQNQVSRLMAENSSLQRRLSYYDRNKEVVSPKRKTLLVDKFFKGCS